MSRLRRFRKRLERLVERLRTQEAVLRKCRKREKRWRQKAQHARDEQTVAEARGERRKAARCKRRAERFHRRRVYWRGRIRETTAKINHLEKSEAEVEADIAKLQRTRGARQVAPNAIRGGKPEERLKLAIQIAHVNYKRRQQPGYYSQTGRPRVYSRGLKGYPHGHVWDCSTFADAMYYVCDLRSPSGPRGYRDGGYTGTQMQHGRVVSAAQARPGDLVIYLRYPGDTIGHHVEVIDDPERRVTMGHGDAAIDRAGGGATGYDIFGDGLYVIRSYH